MINTLWGVSSLPVHRTSSAPLVEVDSWFVPENPPVGGFVLRFSHWYLSALEVTEHEERIDNLIDQLQASPARAGLLSLTAKVLEAPCTPKRIRDLTVRCRDLRRPFFFDPGQLGCPAWMDPKTCVFDPMWFGDPPWSPYWKIHGWHPERWVRRYSESQLLKLIVQAKRHAPQFVMLAHPQRLEQWEWLQSQIAKGASP